MPDRADIPWHKQVKLIESQYYYPRYIAKAKTKGLWKGKLVEDKYKCKRLLFKKNLSIRKVGTVGQFWAKPKKALWQEIRDVEKQIGDGLEQPGVEELADFVADMIGEPLTDVKRKLGYYANEPTIQEWIEKVVHA
jgi:hypothetical protein